MAAAVFRIYGSTQKCVRLMGVRNYLIDGLRQVTDYSGRSSTHSRENVLVERTKFIVFIKSYNVPRIQ